MHLTIDGFPTTVQMELQHVIFTDDETPNGDPRMAVTTSPFDAVDSGFLTFWPDPAEQLRQVPLLSWLPTVYLRGQAVQLGGMFATALHVTKDVPAYAARRQAILDHYNTFFDEWAQIAEGYDHAKDCGSSYHGLNIAFLPLYNWVRLEQDPTRHAALQQRVLNRMWSVVEDHKNVFFAYIFASQSSQSEAAIVASHNDQLTQFPSPPNISVGVDHRGDYPADPNCGDDISAVAMDVRDRISTSFLWERQPWKLVGAVEPNMLYPGIDYLITYWMARRYDFLADDSAQICLQWRD
jgi:hypothetical protein